MLADRVTDRILHVHGPMWNPDGTSISYQHMKTSFCDWSILSTMGGYDVIQCQKSGLLRRSAPPLWENCIARRSSLRDLLSDWKRRRIFSIVYWLTCISMNFSSESESSIHWFFGSNSYHENELILMQYRKFSRSHCDCNLSIRSRRSL